jgi:hypothetical protein
MTEGTARVLGCAALVFAASVALIGCGDDAEMGGGAALGGDSGGGFSGGSGGGAGTSSTPTGGSSVGGSATGGSGGRPPDPEEELESAFEAPVATDRFVWAANPESGNVAVIDATTFAVRLARAGFRPTTVAGLPGADGEDGAIVLNVGSSDATVLRIDAEGALASTKLDTHTGANAVAVAPSGRFAVVWTDAAKLDRETLDPTDSFQDVTVLSLGEEAATTMLSVGYRPSRVVFDAAEERALVVTEHGLSVLTLGEAPRASALVELTANPVDDPAARDVSITPDGAFALVRLDGSTELGVVELATGERRAVGLGDFVTDLDLSADGSVAFAVTGSTASTETTLVVIPVPVGDPSSFRRATVPNIVGRSVSISPGGELALLYSNAEPNPYLGMLVLEDTFATYASRALDLKAPVRAVFASPVGTHGIAFQTTDAASTKRGAFSLISAAPNRAPKIVATDAAPMSVAFSPDGASAVVATRDLALSRFGAYVVHMEAFEETFVTLPSPPLAAGIVPLAGQAFVAQAHPEGRITFVNLEDGRFKTLTGFELAGRVVE